MHPVLKTLRGVWEVRSLKVHVMRLNSRSNYIADRKVQEWITRASFQARQKEYENILAFYSLPSEDEL